MLEYGEAVLYCKKASFFLNMESYVPRLIRF